MLDLSLKANEMAEEVVDPSGRLGEFNVVEYWVFFEVSGDGVH